MAKQSKAQKDTVERVMHEYKHGELRIRGKGPKVKDLKQAIAIALREAGTSKYESPRENRETLKKTKARERKGETAQARAEGTKSELYEQAKRQGIPGRSKMSKSELERAVRS
ncbi:MAG TPA: DUF6496 domain-containing protein [Rhizobiaceae bacterium]|nr:DUF6496 domain-containing protein [Rhizobiaceae bacterium]